MIQIRTVLCPVGLDGLDPGELALAVEVCRSFGARLVLLHNLGVAPLGAAMSWMWQQEHPGGGSTEAEAAERLREMLAALPEGIEAEAHLCAGVVGPAILEMEERVGADLVVMTTRGASTEEHASVAEQIIERSSCPVLVLRDGCDPAAVHFQAGARELPLSVLVATDLTPSAEPALAYAFELARSLSMRVHLLHVLPHGADLGFESGLPMVLLDERADPVDRARAQMESLVPCELEHRVAVHVAVGDPAGRIAEVSQRLGVSCILVGAHARGLLRRFFTRDTSRALLHQAPCPVWIVPGARAA